jgi:hypothetical protein
MPLVAGFEPANTLDTIENQTRDFVANFGIKPGTTLPIARGGTGATTAPAALVNLTAVGQAEVCPGDLAEAEKIPRYNNTKQLTAAVPLVPDHVATKGYVDARFLLRDALLDLIGEVQALTARVAVLEARPGPPPR